MKARRPNFRAAITPMAAIVFAGGTAAAADAQIWNVQGVMSGTTWSAWVNQAQVVQTPLTTGGTAGQLTMQTSYLPAPLVDFIAASLAGKSPSTPLQLVTVSSTGTLSTLMKIGSTRLQEVDLPAANASNTGPTFLTLKFAPASAEVGKPSVLPPLNPRGQDLHGVYFQLKFDSLDATTAMVVNSVSLVLPDILQGKLPQLVVTTSTSSQVWNNGLQKWMDSQTTKTGTLTFFASDFKTVLLVERFRGVRVLSKSGTTTTTVTFAMTGANIQGAVSY